MEWREGKHPPIWRQTRHHPVHGQKWAGRRRQFVKPSSLLHTLTIHCLSFATLVFALVPGHFSQRLPISFGLKAGDPMSWAILVSLMASLLCISAKEGLDRRLVSALALLGVVACLTVVCFTDPLSTVHLNAFTCAIVIEAVWFLMAGAFAEHIGLSSLCILCLFGAIATTIFVGPGERFLILTGLAGLNFAIYLPRRVAWASQTR